MENASQLIRLNPELSKRELARRIAFNSEEDLFPFHCIDILKDLYGKRLESMKPKIICDIINVMLSAQVEPDMQDIIKEVNDYCNDF